MSFQESRRTWCSRIAACAFGAVLAFIMAPSVASAETAGEDEAQPLASATVFSESGPDGLATLTAQDKASSLVAPQTTTRYIQDVPYVKRSGSGSKLKSFEQTCVRAKSLTGQTTLDGGWFCLDSDLEVSKRMEATKDTSLILMDGKTLKVSGIYIHKGVTLTVYGQEGDSGKIVSKPGTGAGIGAAPSNRPGGNFVVHGGIIEAKGANHCAGIGGNDGNGDEMGEFIMYGGNVTAIGGGSGAGIGGGRACKGGVVKIFGGTVTAKGGKYAAGIGGGNGIGNDPMQGGHGGYVHIEGGKINATGGADAAGIGGGEGGNVGKFVIYGGDVVARGGDNGAGIGCGEAESTGRNGYIEFYGGTVHAYGGKNGAGVGGGDKGNAYGIKVDGGKVYAYGGKNGAGIGGGRQSCGGEYIFLYGTFVYAVGGKDAAGVGGGAGGDAMTLKGDILMYGGSITAKGRGEASGVGAGKNGKQLIMSDLNYARTWYSKGETHLVVTTESSDYAPIGAKKGNMEGDVNIGWDTTYVDAGTNVNNAKRRLVDNRGAFREPKGNYLEIGRCDHGDGVVFRDVNGEHVGTCKYCGGTVKPSDLGNDRKDLVNSQVTLKRKYYAYDGKAKTAVIKSVVLDGKELAKSDYKVIYKNNVKVGTATAILKGKGDYCGSIKVTFNIVPGKPQLKVNANLNSGCVKASWNKVAGAKSYQLQWREKGGTLKSGTVKGTKAIVKGLEPGKTCQLRVRGIAGKVKGFWSATATC